jgi:ABC-2 type transport system permease protein
MFHLILKEFLVQKKTLIFGFLYVFIAPIAFSKLVPDGGAIYTTAPFAVIYLFVLYSSGHEDKNKTDIIFNSLPLRRDDIVIAKYLSIFFFAAFGIVSSIVVSVLSRYIGFLNITRSITTNDIIIVLSAGMIFASVFYPLYLKFGLNKMRVFNILFFLFIFFLPSFVMEYMQANPDKKFINSAVTFVVNAPSWQLKALMLVCSTIVMLSSMLIAFQIYKNKDF